MLNHPLHQAINAQGIRDLITTHNPQPPMTPSRCRQSQSPQPPETPSRLQRLTVQKQITTPSKVRLVEQEDLRRKEEFQTMQKNVRP